MRNLSRSITAALTGITMSAALWPHDALAGGPVLVELFTSQGCHSCLPADAMLGELAQRDDVIALAFHVTYWDRLGWTDTFGDPAHDARQRAYRAKLGRGLYTPQMVIDGRADIVGSHPAIPQALDSLGGEIAPAGIDIAGDGTFALPAFGDEAVELWAVAVDDHEDVDIQRGENGGKRLSYHAIVREFLKLDAGRIEAARLPLQRWSDTGHDRVVVAAQDVLSGAVLALGERSLSRSD